MRIANPIYDVVFKYLLDEKARETARALEEKDKMLEELARIIADLKRQPG